MFNDFADETQRRGVRIDTLSWVRFDRCDRRFVQTRSNVSWWFAYLPPHSRAESNVAVERSSGDGALRVFVTDFNVLDGEPDDSVPILEATPGLFRLLPSFQQQSLALGSHFGVEIAERVYLATPDLQYTEWRAPDGRSLGTLEWPAYIFEHMFHPYLCEIGQALYEGGPTRLLKPPTTLAGELLDRQQLSEPPTEGFFRELRPTGFVLNHDLEAKIDFDAGGSYSVYNWELFFHIPLLVAERLMQNQRFEQAREWLHFLFDPTDVSTHRSPQKFWRPWPLYRRAMMEVETIDELLEALASGDLAAEDQIAAWKSDPFNPHLLARHRTLAYMRTVVMKYVENLIAWGDQLFKRDTIESLNEATQLYVLAAEILGDEGLTIEAPERGARSYVELGELDDFANALEDAIPAGGAGRPLGPVPRTRLYFCIPRNEKLAQLRRMIADRLSKVRNCQDIEGRFRQLPLFEPSIDPGLLVRARAAGLDIGEALSLADAVSLPGYRYSVLAAKALELCGDVRALGSAVSSALERRDGEQLARLRSRHEVTLLERVSEIKRKQIDEARESLRALEENKRAAGARKAKLEAWAEEYRNSGEAAQLGHLHDAHGFEVASQVLEIGAAVAHLFPDFKVGIDAGSLWGGSFLGNSFRATAGVLKGIAGQYTFEASMSATEGAHKRRQDEWRHQADLAEIEVKQIERQILAAEIRVAVAEADERNHQTQLEQAKEVGDFLRRKFSNQELYGWMVGEVSKLYRDSYQAARDLAVRAERAAQHQLGVRAEAFRFIDFDHWDSLHRGLLAGEKLHSDLRRLETAYLAANERELEITKHISLTQLAPQELVKLRETGRCEFSIPEWLFDVEFPGHYRRRIRSVSVTVPAVTGPTTNVGAVLTLDSSSIRRTPDAAVALEPGFAAQRSIATSTANRDAGVFELNFRDERYLPFEGAGAISDWSLELPAAIPTFDYDTISDVIIHMSYTTVDEPAQAGGARPLRDAVVASLETKLESWLSAGVVRVFSLKRELSSEFHQLLHPEEGTVGSTTLNIAPRHFPPLLRGFADRLQVKQVAVVAKVEASGSAGRSAFSREGETPALLALASTTDWSALPHAVFPAGRSFDVTPLQTWTLQFEPGAAEDSVEDIYIALALELGPEVP